MPDAVEYFGGFWGSVAPSPVIDALAAGCTVIAEGAVAGAAAPSATVLVVSSPDATAVAGTNGRVATAYPAPGLTGVWCATDTVGAPALCVGLDFSVGPDTVTFDTDPLTATGYPVWSGGAPVHTGVLWVGVPGVPAAGPVTDATTYTAATAALARYTGSPCTSDAETVEDVFVGPFGSQVVTDRGVYRLGPADAPSVAPGALLGPGTPVGSAWTLTPLGPDKPALGSVTTPARLLQGSAPGGVTWYDETVPLVVDVVDGRTRVRFSLGAASQDEFDAFWAASHTNGVANGRTLAQALDTRAAPTGDPDATSLPASVNPLELLCRELLATNAYLAVVDPSRYGPGADASVPVERPTPYTTVIVYPAPVPALTRYTPS